MGYTLFINTKMEVKLTFSYKKLIPIVPQKESPIQKRYISQLPRSSKNKKRHKMCSLQIHLGTQLLGNLLLFQPQDEGSALDVTMWEEPVDLVLNGLAHSSSLSLSQLSRPLSPHPHDGIWWPPRADSTHVGCYRTQWFWVAISFTSFRGLTYRLDSSYSDLRLPP